MPRAVGRPKRRFGELLRAERRPELGFVERTQAVVDGLLANLSRLQVTAWSAS